MNDSVSKMTDIHDINPPIDPDLWVLILTISIISLISVVIFFYLLRYVYIILNKNKDNQRKYVKPKPYEPPIDYKNESLKKLNNLIEKIENGKLDLHFSFVELSEVIRWFIEGIYNNKALKKTKSELVYLNIEKLNEILAQCYIVEFAKEEPTKNTALEYTKSAIRLIETWV